MSGGFQPVAFQVNFQQSAIVAGTGIIWVERAQFRNLYKSNFAPTYRLLFKSKRAGETVFLKPAFDFVSALAPGETILTAVVTAVVYTGNDPSPSSIISGSAVVNGTQVTQLVTGGVTGTIYGLTCTVTTSSGETLNSSGFFSVDPALV